MNETSTVMTLIHIHIEYKAKDGSYREDDNFLFVHVEFKVFQFFPQEQFKVCWMFVSGGQIRGSSRRLELVELTEKNDRLQAKRVSAITQGHL